MCRLFAQVSTKPESARDLLVDSEFSLLRQADGDPKNPQKEGWGFIHNGTLAIFKEVAEALGPRRARLKTDSDSEIYFQQFLKHLAVTKDPSRTFETYITENWTLRKDCRSRYPGMATPY